MELWIRSQDREKIVKSSYLSLFLSDTTWFIYTDTNTGEPFDIGKYKTKEKALEILDEIQNIISGKTILKSFDNVTSNFNDKVIIKPCEVKIEQLNTYVYEMPKE